MEDYFKKDRYDFSQLIGKIKAMEIVPNIITDEETNIEIYNGNKILKDKLIDILRNFNTLDNLVQDECENEYRKNQFAVYNYQFSPTWIDVSSSEVIVGYWGTTVNSDFEQKFTNINGKWELINK